MFGTQESERKRREKRENSKPKEKSCVCTQRLKVRVTKLWGSLYRQTQSVKIQKCINMKLHKGQNGNLSKRGRLESKIPKTQAEEFLYAVNFASIAKFQRDSEIENFC